ncbi:MAG: GGDEF domain-containing protein [Pseudomonadota bacterium]|nr:GGDEF domain-containing protein [Pseudomonadota bacterium]
MSGFEHIPKPEPIPIPTDVDARTSKDTKLSVFLRFSTALEQRYCAQQNHHAALSFRYRAITIFLLYIVLSTGIAGLLAPEQIWPWLSIYGWVGVIVVVAGILASFRVADRWFTTYVSWGSAVSIALSLTAAAVIQGETSGILLHVAIMYAVIIVYGFTGLRFYHVTAAGWGGGLVGIIMSRYLDGALDWQLLLRTYSGPSLLGMCLAYAADYRSRLNFMQACALEQAHQESEAQNQRLQLLNREDGLTGLSNRRHLDDMLTDEWNRAMRQQSPLALLMIDIDFFKHYNDHLGHPAGDECLRRVADQIRMNARRSGDVAARYGGEEFSLLYPSTNATQAVHLARELINNINQLMIVHPESAISPYVSVSVGVAVIIPPYGTPAHVLLDQADHALYDAKQQGRNRCVLYGVGEVVHPSVLP